MKKDIFHGKIKKEYFSYILGYMIFFVVLLIGVGALCIYASALEMTNNALGERFLIASFGGIAFVLAGVYVFLEMLVIRRFPKYEKIRRILFNSDIYFTDSTSNEYFGKSTTIRGRMNKAAFNTITAFAEAEKGMGKKKPIRYTVYSTLALIMAVLGLVDLIVMPLLFENGIIFSNIPQNVLLFCYISGGIACIGFAIFFLIRALENHKWTYELYSSLVDISVRRNNKKLKFWYKVEQLDEIKNLTKKADGDYKVVVVRKSEKPISFSVVDTTDEREVFKGMFI